MTLRPTAIHADRLVARRREAALVADQRGVAAVLLLDDGLQVVEDLRPARASARRNILTM